MGYDSRDEDEVTWEATRPFYRRPKIWLLVTILALGFWFTPWIPKLYYSAFSVTRLDAKGQPIQVEVGPKTKQWVKIENVSKHLLHAIVVAEDGKFYQHHGFDFEAIQKAYKLNQKKGRFARGGSTISQQVVKMAFLSREKTYTRKLREAVGTVLMELLLSKDKILEWYINLTEFGGGVYGVKQAGQYYFRTRPDLLTTEQAIHLALVIPSPNKWSKGLKARNLTPFGHRRFARIATNLHRAGYIGSPELHAILAKGNFGSPIAGYRVAQDNEEDDCKGAEKECEDDAVLGVQQKKNTAPDLSPNEPEPGTLPSAADVPAIEPTADPLPANSLAPAVEMLPGENP